LMDVELEQPESAVTADLRFDYCEDELSFWFDCSPDASYLCVMPQDVLWTEPLETGTKGQ
jgi:hypothetical protein